MAIVDRHHQPGYGLPTPGDRCRINSIEKQELSPGLETDGSRQFELPVVEAPESFRPELKGTGDVKAIQRADPEFCPMPAGQVSAQIERLFRHIDPKPQSSALVILQLAVQLLCFGRAELSTKHVLRNCVCPFRAVKGRQPQT